MMDGLKKHNFFCTKEKIMNTLTQQKIHTIVCGDSHTVALTSNNTVKCWGDNLYNQCDPVHLTFTNAIQVVCGHSHSVVLFSNGTVQCWGQQHMGTMRPCTSYFYKYN